MASHAVEFVGGPLDGYTHRFTHSPDRLSWITGVPVSRALIRSVGGRRKTADGPVTSVALYQLHEDDDGLRYFHLRSVSEEEVELEDAEAEGE